MRAGRGFDGMPLGQRREPLICGVDVIELESGQSVSRLELSPSIHETFDVQVLPGVRCPAISGPYNTKDGSQPMWIVPEFWTRKTS
jgi:hypothetical protein